MSISIFSAKLAAFVTRVRWRLISVPIYVKVFGIGLFISVLFAGIAFWLVRNSVLQAHYQVHGETALSVAVSLASRLQTADLSQKAAVDHDLNETMAAFPSVRYILVQDVKGRILSHGFTFPKDAPPDIAKRGEALCASCHAGLSPLTLPSDLLEVRPNVVLPSGSLRAYRRPQGLVLEVTAPIGDGHLGSVRLGVGDKSIARDLASVNHSILAGLALCLFATVCSALLLTYVLNKPIHALLAATKIVAKGDFSARARVYSDDELGRLAAAFNRMTEGLAESRRRVMRAERLASVGEFAAGVAHEINNPLDGVMSCLARLQRAPANLSQNMEYLEMIQHALKRVSGVIQRLLEYSQTREMNKQPEDIRSIVENVVAFVRVTARQSGVEVECDFGETPEVSCDRYHLEQALLNLALNGLAAMPKGGTLTFRTSAVVEHEGLSFVQLDVADTGAGIAPENKDKIFDAFFTTKEPGKGTGLGLAIVKEIVEAHSGNISVESNVGKGTVFHVLLPVSACERSVTPRSSACASVTAVESEKKVSVE